MSGWTERIAWRLPGAILIGLLAGCAPDTARESLDDYLLRVARVTDGSAPLPSPTPGPPYPRHRLLVVDIPERQIDLSEFIELHGCDMGDLIGLRNSPLGRLQAPSQRLGYEAAWLQAMARCGSHAQDWMTALAAEKARSLPALFWNATFAGVEMRGALGAGAGPGANSEPQDDEFADALRGLHDSLEALLAGSFDVSAMERQLVRLNRRSWLGPAREDWALWRGYLGALAGLLDQAGNSLCLNQRPTPRSRRLENVFMKFYVAELQPELARRMQRQGAWILELQRLAERLEPVQPPAFSAWFETVLSAPDSEWQRTRRAVVTHARAWQRTFARCGIEPIPGLRQD